MWRPGQTQAVKAVFAIYNNAMEARALALMGQKMKAGQTLYGDEVGGAIVPEDEGDLLLKLAREALNKADLPDLQSLFTESCRIDLPAVKAHNLEKVVIEMGMDSSPVPTRTITFDNWMEGRGAGFQNSNRKKKVIEGQASLFELLD